VIFDGIMKMMMTVVMVVVMAGINR